MFNDVTKSFYGILLNFTRKENCTTCGHSFFEEIMQIDCSTSALRSQAQGLSIYHQLTLQSVAKTEWLHWSYSSAEKVDQEKDRLRFILELGWVAIVKKIINLTFSSRRTFCLSSIDFAVCRERSLKAGSEIRWSIK